MQGIDIDSQITNISQYETKLTLYKIFKNVENSKFWARTRKVPLCDENCEITRKDEQIANTPDERTGYAVTIDGLYH